MIMLGKRLCSILGLPIAILAMSFEGDAHAVAGAAPEAAAVLANQWAALGGDADQIFLVDETSAAGLFPPRRNGAVVVPAALLSEARTAGDIRAYLALRRAYHPGTARRPRHLDATATALGYLGLGLGYAGLEGRQNDRGRIAGGAADPDRRISNAAFPSSDLDNAPASTPQNRPSPARLAEALAKGGCESDAIALLTRLAARATGARRSDAVATDAARVLHDLGMFAFHPASRCDRIEDPALAVLKVAL